jgi:predicted N-acyltransferase
MHFLSHPGLGKAVDRFLEQERRAMAQELEWLDDHSAIKKR